MHFACFWMSNALNICKNAKEKLVIGFVFSRDCSIMDLVRELLNHSIAIYNT